MRKPNQQWAGQEKILRRRPASRVTLVLISALLVTGCASKPEHLDTAAQTLLFSAATGGDKAALQRLRALAEGGDAEAQINMGVLYDRGQGVPKDSGEAAAWYRKAAEQGDALGQHNLGSMYEEGEGVPKDLVIAYMWQNLAAAQGKNKSFADYARSDLEKHMTPDQIAEAQKLSREWKPKR
jgi:TPR repeat protein